MRTALLLLGLLALPVAADQRSEARDVLARKLDPELYAKFKPMLDSRFDSNHSLQLTRQEEADLRELWGDAPAQLRLRYQQYLRQQLVPPTFVPAAPGAPGAPGSPPGSPASAPPQP